MSAIVNCPHCRGSIENNPSLAGQPVSCPHCSGQFTMPQIARPAVVSPAQPAPGPFDFSKPSPTRSASTSRYRKPRKKTPVLWIIGGCFGGMILLCGVIGALVDNGNSDRPANPVGESKPAVPTMSDAEIEAAAERRMEEIGLGSKVTYKNFQQIRTGMGEAEVYDILGYAPEVVSENEFGTGEFRTKTRLLRWKEDFKVIDVTMQNGKVVQKTQFGLN